jgi:hypothetical protein
MAEQYSNRLQMTNYLDIFNDTELLCQLIALLKRSALSFILSPPDHGRIPTMKEKGVKSEYFLLFEDDICIRAPEIPTGKFIDFHHIPSSDFTEKSNGIAAL